MIIFLLLVTGSSSEATSSSGDKTPQELSYVHHGNGAFQMEVETK